MSSPKELFNKIDQIEPSARLHQSILLRVELYQKAKVFRLKMSYYLTIVLSAVAIIPASQLVAQSIAQSDLYQFIPLIFSDFDIVVNQWQSFALSIIESLPIVEITALLSLALLIVWAINAINKIQPKNNLLQIKTI
ncbi:MAG: hypothetical protein HY226_04265 [Candidatus Vogelbacteria bacterium]|nr:hypothetical protein [Candidatus Vogelbacteria bacterium]